MKSSSSNTMKKAEKICERLSGGFPRFKKVMMPSHVSRPFWLSVPVKFVRAKHMPEWNEYIVLEDEAGQNYSTKYLEVSHAFSGGWNGFAVAHNLDVGDVVIFQKILPLKFKVIIVKGNKDSSHEEEEEEEEEDVEEDVACALLSLSKQAPKDMGGSSGQQAAEMTTSPLLLCQNNSRDDRDRRNGGFSSSSLDFGKFEAQLRECDVLAKLPKSYIIPYYELCCSQNMYLHQHLLGKWTSLSVAGTIGEVTVISDAVRSSDLSTPLEKLRQWDSQLADIERKGMEVKFLRERLLRLIHLATNPSREKGSARIVEAKHGRDELISKVVQMNDTIDDLNREIKALKEKEEEDRRDYLNEARASW